MAIKAKRQSKVAYLTKEKGGLDFSIALLRGTNKAKNKAIYNITRLCVIARLCVSRIVAIYNLRLKKIFLFHYCKSFLKLVMCIALSNLPAPANPYLAQSGFHNSDILHCGLSCCASCVLQ